MDFRDVTALLLGAEVEVESLKLAAGSVRMSVRSEGNEATTISFDGVTKMTWKAPGPRAESQTVAVTGLEKLGTGEVWRLYVQATSGAELELSCRAIDCEGREVTGLGRSYRH